MCLTYSACWRRWLGGCTEHTPHLVLTPRGLPFNNRTRTFPLLLLLLFMPLSPPCPHCQPLSITQMITVRQSIILQLLMSVRSLSTLPRDHLSVNCFFCSWFYVDAGWVSVGDALLFVCSAMVAITAHVRYPVLLLFIPNKQTARAAANLKCNIFWRNIDWYDIYSNWKSMKITMSL